MRHPDSLSTSAAPYRGNPSGRYRRSSRDVAAACTDLACSARFARPASQGSDKLGRTKADRAVSPARAARLRRQPDPYGGTAGTRRAGPTGDGSRQAVLCEDRGEATRLIAATLLSSG
jgi:hypothetical protein